MALVKAFSKVEKDGRIKLPANVQRAAGFKEGQLLELRIIGASRKKNILITSRKVAE